MPNPVLDPYLGGKKLIKKIFMRQPGNFEFGKSIRY